MKFIINESKINSLVEKYLNSFDWKVWNYSDDEVSVYDGYPGKRVFYTSSVDNPRHRYRTDNDKKEYILHISDSFDQKFKGFFGFGTKPWFLIKWFNEKFNSNCVTFRYEVFPNDTSGDEEFYGVEMDN